MPRPPGPYPAQHFLLPIQFLVAHPTWVTLDEHRWVISGERRGNGTGFRLIILKKTVWRHQLIGVRSAFISGFRPFSRLLASVSKGLGFRTVEPCQPLATALGNRPQDRATEGFLPANQSPALKALHIYIDSPNGAEFRQRRDHRSIQPAAAIKGAEYSNF
jgi:hypothetical protein